jgi:hypothetical protein
MEGMGYEVVAFVSDQNGRKGCVVRHVMPLSAVGDRRALIGAGEVIGQTIARRLGVSGGNQRAAMLLRDSI